LKQHRTGHYNSQNVILLSVSLQVVCVCYMHAFSTQKVSRDGNCRCSNLPWAKFQAS